jgi:biopolymer transport protein ExbD
MKKSSINCIKWILNSNNNTTLIMTSTLLTLAFFMMTLTYFSESIQIASATTESNKQIVQQGIATSTPDPLPGHEAHQSVTILRLKGDNTVYEGTLSFIASKPVEVQILHRNMTSSSQLPKISTQFGTMTIIPLPGGNGQVVSSLVLPQYPEEATSFSASLPFAGNGLALHNLEGDEFVATYTVIADAVGSPQRGDDIAIAAPEPAGDEDEEEDGDEEDN